MPSATTPPLDLLPIPIDAYRDGNTGIPFAHRLDSGRVGPSVAITALIHGNEVCGAHALDLLLRSQFRPSQGSLTLIFCNVAAYMRFDPRDPTASRFVDEDMNRVWDTTVLRSARSSVELERAREIEPLVAATDLLLDIHSMQTPSPALMLSGQLAKGRDLARLVGVPGHVVADAGHKAGKRMRDYGGFGEAGSAKNALLVECGQHWAADSRAMAIETMLRFLLATGQADTALLARHGLALQPAQPQHFVEVTDAITIETEEFRFLGEFQGLECIPAAGTAIAQDGPVTLRTPYDDCVLIMPTKRLKPGQTAVRLGRRLPA
ncbi:succinylglutamate desuccinylase/aspartoacylase family protein [Ferrovibrio sp.]|uniref:succinylglutamate desuccinylase/aspartoacylase domain-containing protein n=1 Tax=Ferrovibrio sp. TaxID=1917215 RepID=UPI001B76ED76|nr:succinylglutamate desuccinylase/aspartoacylase family protein [Ferrovibrio sp.]MBP7065756.1 succinylglutamate desuccinylase/aspartoacylase family protein [Ferrovibrio sp.]